MSCSRPIEPAVTMTSKLSRVAQAHAGRRPRVSRCFDFAAQRTAAACSGSRANKPALGFSVDAWPASYGLDSPAAAPTRFSSRCATDRVWIRFGLVFRMGIGTVEQIHEVITLLRSVSPRAVAQLQHATGIGRDRRRLSIHRQHFLLQCSATWPHG